MALEIYLPTRKKLIDNIELTKQNMKTLGNNDSAREPYLGELKMLEDKFKAGLYSPYGPFLSSAYLRIDKITIVEDMIQVNCNVFSSKQSRDDSLLPITNVYYETLYSEEDLNESIISFAYKKIKTLPILEGPIDI